VFAGSPNHAKSKSSTVSDAAILHFASPHRRNPGAPSFAVAAATEGWDKKSSVIQSSVSGRGISRALMEPTHLKAAGTSLYPTPPGVIRNLGAQVYSASFAS
jgi:uncharacterized protein (UPF0210 family)